MAANVSRALLWTVWEWSCSPPSLLPQPGRLVPQVATQPALHETGAQVEVPPPATTSVLPWPSTKTTIADGGRSAGRSRVPLIRLPVEPQVGSSPSQAPRALARQQCQTDRAGSRLPFLMAAFSRQPRVQVSKGWPEIAHVAGRHAEVVDLSEVVVQNALTSGSSTGEPRWGSRLNGSGYVGIEQPRRERADHLAAWCRERFDSR